MHTVMHAFRYCTPIAARFGALLRPRRPPSLIGDRRQIGRQLLSTGVPTPPTAEQENLRAYKVAQSFDYDSLTGMTGADIVTACLHAQDVDTVFGYPGGAILPVIDALAQSQTIQFVLPRHEQGGGHAAQGYARVTGRPGVVCVTSGPGATNVITPMVDALMDGTPLVVLTGQVPTLAMGTDAFQEADCVGLSRPATKWNVLVKDVKDIAQAIHAAFFVATHGRPGPVLVDLPKDVTSMPLVGDAERGMELQQRMLFKDKRAGMLPEVIAAQGQGRTVDGMDPRQRDALMECARRLRLSDRPVLYVGQGVLQAGAQDLLRELAVRLQAPVTTTLQGMGAFDERDPLALRMLGMHGSVAANRAVQQADCVLALGARFDDRVTGRVDAFAPAARAAAAVGRGGILHFERSPKQAGKVITPDVQVMGDVGYSLRALLEVLDQGEGGEGQVPRELHTETSLFTGTQAQSQARVDWLQRVRAWQTDYSFEKVALGQIPEAEGGHLPSRRPLPTKQDRQNIPDASFVLRALDKALESRGEKDDTVFTTGVGQHQMWVAQSIKWTKPRQLVTSGGSGTMGFGVPSAIGAAIGRGLQRQGMQGSSSEGDGLTSRTVKGHVICVDGDASFVMSGLELLTAAEYGVPVKVLVMNNGTSGMIQQWQRLFYDGRMAVSTMLNPDFAKLAEVLGGTGVRCTSLDGLDTAIEAFLNAKGPVVLDCAVSEHSNVLPMVPSGKALHEMVLV